MLANLLPLNGDHSPDSVLWLETAHRESSAQNEGQTDVQTERRNVMYEEKLRWRWVALLVLCVLAAAWIEVPAQTTTPTIIYGPGGGSVVCIQIAPNVWDCQ